MTTTSSATRSTFTLASRGSKLAQVQTHGVLASLSAAHPSLDFQTAWITPEGDRNKEQALYLLGGKALWTKELEVALLQDEVDMLVHCLKDVPTVLPPGCEIAAILEREDPVDSLVVKAGAPWKSLEDLPDGSVIGTSSVRRVAQLRRAFPKLTFLDCVRALHSSLYTSAHHNSDYSAEICMFKSVTSVPSYPTFSRQ